jgi:acetolactate synthase I/II/III large subunit
MRRKSLVDLPKDVAQASVPFPAAEPDRASVHPFRPDPETVSAAEAMIAQARKPVLYFGGGVPIAGAEEALRAFFQRTGIPAVATLKGLGALPTWWPGYLGMLGMHGTRAANMAVDGCDLLICVGARFDDRATGRLDSFAPRAKVIHIDGDPAEISKLRHADLAMAGDIRAILNALDPDTAGIGDWRAECARNAVRWAMRYDAPGSGVYAPALLKAISEAAGDDFIAACDVGQHQMWVAQHCRFARPQAHLTSGGLGAMGYGVPAGFGAALADPSAKVFVVTGDGSIMMNIQELATIRRYRIPVKIVLLDNSQLGMVRQWQELFYAENFSEVDLSDNPDFAEVARSFGIEAFTLDRRADVPAAVERLMSTSGPILCHVRIDPRENVWPLVPPGKSNAEMMEP